MSYKAKKMKAIGAVVETGDYEMVDWLEGQFVKLEALGRERDEWEGIAEDHRVKFVDFIHQIHDLAQEGDIKEIASTVAPLCASTPRELKLFELDDGASYYIGAWNRDDALEIYEQEILDGDEEHLEQARESIRELTQGEAEEASFYGSDGERVRSMWQEFQNEGRGVLGCSEW